MLHSLYGQSYDNWRLILIDDVSNHDHAEKCNHAISQFSTMGKPHQIEVLWNIDKKWEVANVLEGIKRCEDDDIVCRIDADDWLVFA